MPHKDMKDFIKDFFNPPKFTKPSTGKKKVVKKKKKKNGPTPMQRQLEETNDFMKYKINEFENCMTGIDRVLLVYKTIPDEATTIDRLWPTELMNKDSRLRRELSTKGKEHFNIGEYDETLDSYNEAILFSSGKGLGHTLARRAAFLLHTKEHLLALRDLSLALEYGCLENELLDFLLDHHKLGNPVDIVVGRKLEMRYVSTYNQDKKRSDWVEKIRKVLDEFEGIRKMNSSESKQAKANKLQEIITYVRMATDEDPFEKNFEAKLIEVPKLENPNFLYPSLSEAVDVCHSKERGRHVVANRDIAVGEIITINNPICTLLCPEKLDKLKNHCLNCHLFTKAPIPCETCCAVVFCSKECRRLACQSYHKYECEMRLYELIPLEGKEMFGYFLALRAVTQRPLKYFLDHKEMFEVFIDLDEPLNTAKDMIYMDDDYKTMMNLITHINDMPECLTLKNAVISVFFLRFLQHGKYFKHYVPEKRKGDRSLHPTEKLILQILHHLIAVQCFNSQQVTELAVETSTYKWESIGAAINTSIALINHSCDPNTFRFNMNKTCVLISSKHIKKGEEITVSYSVDFKSFTLQQREYQMLKYYMFQCECRACVEKWPLRDALLDELARIPNFEQERCFVIRHGDKKDICDEINGARWMADFGLTSNTFHVAQEALDVLSRSLEKHICQPHLFFVEAGELAEKFAINQYCRMPLDDIDKSEENIDEKNNHVNGNGCNEAHNQESHKRTELHKDKIKEIYESSHESSDGTNKLIKSFETGTDSKSVQTVPARQKSPTLRIFSSGDKSENGQKKKSVLDRLDETKFKSSADLTNTYNTEKSKRDLADSLRRFPVKDDMADRMSAFQPKNMNHNIGISKDDNEPKRHKDKDPNIHQRSQSVNNRDCLKNNSDEEKLTTKPQLTAIKDIEQPLIKEDSVNPKPPIQASDDEINEKVLKAIDMNRRRIREQRKKENEGRDQKLPQDMDGFENISPQRRALMEKDDECQKVITSREEKLNQLIERSLRKEKMLTDRELELQKIRDKTKKMLESAKQKDLEFKASQEAISLSMESSFDEKSEKKLSKKDRILAKANEKAKSLKKEMQSKRADAADNDDDLLAFLRKSHRAKSNIYQFVEKPENANILQTTSAISCNDSITPRDPPEIPEKKSADEPIKDYVTIKVEPPSEKCTPVECKQFFQETINTKKPCQREGDGLSRRKSLSENSLLPKTRKAGVTHMKENINVGSSLMSLDNATENSAKKNPKQKHRFIETPIPKIKHIEERWTDIKVISDHSMHENNSLENEKNDMPPKFDINIDTANHFQPQNVKKSEENNSEDGKHCSSIDFEQTLVNGKHWETQLEDSIRRIDSLSRPRTPEPLLEQNNNGMKHYAVRWSEERNSLSPCKQDSSEKDRSSRSESRSPRISRAKPQRAKINRNISIESDSSDYDNINKNVSKPKNSKPPKPGQLLRRKSLSENCLLPRGKSDNESKDVDAYGLPRLTYRNKRSVSLMRDTFLSRKDSKPPASCDSQQTQRTISRETKTSNATEFKARFESGSASNLSRSSRSSTPYKPPQVDKVHLTKVKNKFKDVDTNNVRLPFPNYKQKPPRPNFKPPPPPIVNF